MSAGPEGTVGAGMVGTVRTAVRTIRERPALGVVLAICVWRCVESLVGTTLQALSPEEANLPILQWLDRPAVAIASVGCAVATLHGRRRAMT